MPHGRWGEDGCVQGLLELMGIPYTHSGVLASALAMHKERAKLVMHAAGVPVADGRVVRRSEAAKAHVLPRPYVLKPVAEGSSVGVHIVREDHEHPPQELHDPGWALESGCWPTLHSGSGADLRRDGRSRARRHRDRPGPDAALLQLRGKVRGRLGPPASGPLSSNVYELVQKLTLTAHKALGCRGVSRADFRYDDTAGGSGELVCLEVNTQPGMTATSLVPELAVHAGLTFAELVSWMVEEASCDR
jgi:D-alanine-D-alanine ligase